MDVLEERIKRFNQVEFFSERPGLAEKICELEKKLGYKMPLTFEVTLMPKYTIGEREIVLGKIHEYFLLGVSMKDGQFIYEIFENKRMLKYFFTTLNGLDSRDLAYWLKEVEAIEHQR